MDMVTKMRRSLVGCGLLVILKVYPEVKKDLPFNENSLNLGPVKVRE